MRKGVLWLLLVVGVACHGQEKTQVDLFCGADLSYSDTHFERLYNVMINVTPGVKWYMGHDWMLAGQLSYAAVNYGYAERNNYLRVGMVALSKDVLPSVQPTKR